MAAVLNVRPRLFKVLSTSIQGEVQHVSFSDDGKLEGLRPDDPGVKPYKDIPGPKAFPIVGSIWRYFNGEYSFKKLHHTYFKFYKDFGPIVKEDLFLGRTIIHLFDPKDMGVVYKMESKYYPDRMSHRAVLKYRAKRKDLYRHPGLGSSNGEEWKDFRQKFPAYVTKENGPDSFMNCFEIVADDLVTKIKSRLEKNDEVELLPMLYDWTLENMGVIALGKRLGCFAEPRDKKLDYLIKAVHTSHYAVYYTENLPFTMCGKHYRALATSQDYIYHYLKRHYNEIYDEWSKAENGGELLDDESQPIRMTNSLLWQFMKLDIGQPDTLTTIIDMFQGGIHSTAHCLSYALYHLALNKDKQLVLHEALMAALPNKTDSIHKLQEKIPYVKQVIYETLRLNPATIGTGRILHEDVVLNGYLVPKKSMCILHHQVAQMQEEHYDNPGSFMPERFEESPWKRDQFAFRPFAYGHRRCFGMGIALLELYVAVAKIMREFEVEYRHEKVDTVNYLLNEPEKQIKVAFKPLSK